MKNTNTINNRNMPVTMLEKFAKNIIKPISIMVTPIIPRSAIREIIEDGYIEKLSPERRFDQSLYFGAE